MERGIVALVFRCEIVAGEPGPTAEAAELGWLAPDQVTANMSDAYSVRLLDALDHEASPIVRGHDGITLVG